MTKCRPKHSNRQCLIIQNLMLHFRGRSIICNTSLNYYYQAITIMFNSDIIAFYFSNKWDFLLLSQDEMGSRHVQELCSAVLDLIFGAMHVGTQSADSAPRGWKRSVSNQGIGSKYVFTASPLCLIKFVSFRNLKI